MKIKRILPNRFVGAPFINKKQQNFIESRSSYKAFFVKDSDWLDPVISEPFIMGIKEITLLKKSYTSILINHFNLVDIAEACFLNKEEEIQHYGLEIINTFSEDIWKFVNFGMFSLSILTQDKKEIKNKAIEILIDVIKNTKSKYADSAILLLRMS